MCVECRSELEGRYPIQVIVENYHLLPSPVPMRTFAVFHSLQELLDCHNPLFRLRFIKHLFSLCISHRSSRNLQQVLEQLGGGFI